MNFSVEKELRLSYDLCQQEIDFVRQRKEFILKNMVHVLGKENAPKTINQVCKTLQLPYAECIIN